MSIARSSVRSSPDRSTTPSRQSWMRRRRRSTTRGRLDGQPPRHERPDLTRRGWQARPAGGRGHLGHHARRAARGGGDRAQSTGGRGTASPARRRARGVYPASRRRDRRRALRRRPCRRALAAPRREGDRRADHRHRGRDRSAPVHARRRSSRAGGGRRDSRPLESLATMIERYTHPEIGAVWTDEARMAAWRDVEVAAAGALDGPSEEDLQAIRTATFTVEAVKERERVTDHDVAAFVDVLGASAGDAGRWIHYGLTSSDVLDTAVALQLGRAGDVIVPGARAVAAALAERAREHAATLCVGRTHGVHAEPTSFGLKLAGFAFEAHRNAERLRDAFAQAATGAISGAVGTYATLGPDYERRALDGLGLAAEPVSTQVVPRDRHAELVQAIALAGTGLERFATEIRHLQRTEVREVEEPFREGQKGSSAMPHKRNPITTERISGLARVLRGYAQAAVEDVALWHERDISQSGAERVILPDATILLDYMQHLTLHVVGGMIVHRDRMLANLELTCGALFSQRVLLALVAGGMARDDAYRTVQRLAQRAWDTQTSLRLLLEAEPGVELDLDAIFDYGHYTRHVPEVLKRLEAIPGA